jgi:hypothetical protein
MFRSRAACIAVLALMLAPAFARSQDLEPRAYVNTPVGLNFLIAGYAYSEGGLSTDPTLPIQDAQLQIHTAVLAYARSLEVWGKPGKFDVIVPYGQLSGTALVAGQPRDRAVNGFADPRFRLSVLLYGAPVLSMKEFAGYRQDTIIGASVQVSAPGGQYDPARAVNIATNRWSVKPEVGISKALGAFILEISTGVTFYTTNHDYFGGKTLEQDPIYSAQPHVTYHFDGGAWGALNGTYYQGGRTTVDGVRGNDALGNSRVGATLALPVDRQNSIKLHASSGVSTRTGTSFKIAGIAWQYRWGEGL